MANESLIGVAELTKKLRDITSSKENKKHLKASVRAAINIAAKQARKNIVSSGVSPGDRLWHKTYKGRIVGAGFASRSVKTGGFSERNDTVIVGKLGVKREAFYAVSFMEVGTSSISKRPWLVPALKGSQVQMTKKLAMELEKRLRKVARTHGPGRGI